MNWPQPSCPLFPYTTLFRSRENLSDHDLFPAGRSGMSLAVSGCGVAVYPPGATFGPRQLEDFEFVWLLQGTAEWRYDLGSIEDRKSTRLNSSHTVISYAVFC